MSRRMSSVVNSVNGRELDPRTAPLSTKHDTWTDHSPVTVSASAWQIDFNSTRESRSRIELREEIPRLLARSDLRRSTCGLSPARGSGFETPAGLGGPGEPGTRGPGGDPGARGGPEGAPGCSLHRQENCLWLRQLCHQWSKGSLNHIN